MRAIVTAVALLAFAALAATAHGVEVAELDRDPTEWEGRQVTVRGELVGDYSARDEVVWVQLNDDAYADTPLLERSSPAGANAGIGVRMPTELFDPDTWGAPGRYGRHGPIVEVTGTFVYNEPVSGDTFVDATGVELIEPARDIDLPVPVGTWIAALVVLVIGVALGIAAVHRQRRNL